MAADDWAFIVAIQWYCGGTFPDLGCALADSLAVRSWVQATQGGDVPANPTREVSSLLSRPPGMSAATARSASRGRLVALLPEAVYARELP